MWRRLIALALVAGCARKGGAGDADAATPIGAGDRVSLVGTVAVEPPFDLAGRTLIGVAGSSAVTFDLAGVERSHVGLRGGPSLRIHALAADPQGRALLAVAFTENVWIEDHAMPFAGFDVYRIERNDAEALPGAFAGVVSEIDAAGDAIVAVGSTLGPVFAPAPAAPWRVINPAGCAADALVVARWVGGRPDWLRCIVRTGTVSAGPMQVNPDGDIVAIFELSAGATVAVDKTRYAAEGGDRFVLVRLDGATGGVTWSLEPAGKLGVTLAATRDVVAVSIDDRGVWLFDAAAPARTPPRQLTPRGTSGIAPGVRGGIVVVDPHMNAPGEVAELDLATGAVRWKFTFAPDLYPLRQTTGDGIVVVAYRAQGGPVRAALLRPN